MTGLVLAGGGVKGSYQVGAYLAFKKCGIKIDGVVGTSIGSFNAAMIVSGKENALYDFWKKVRKIRRKNFKIFCFATLKFLIHLLISVPKLEHILPFLFLLMD